MDGQDQRQEPQGGFAMIMSGGAEMEIRPESDEAGGSMSAQTQGDLGVTSTEPVDMTVDMEPLENLLVDPSFEEGALLGRSRRRRESKLRR